MKNNSQYRFNYLTSDLNYTADCLIDRGFSELPDAIKSNSKR